MKLDVYEMQHSPFCIPITHMLTVASVPFKRHEVPNWDRSEIIRRSNGAYYQVPLLIHDQRPIYETGPDTQDVARYVDATFLKGALFPPRLGGLQSVVIDFLENEVEARTFKLVDPHYLDTVEDPVARTMTIRHKERKFGRGCVDQWRSDAGRLRSEADALLGRFESTLQHTPFVFGERPTYADFLLFGILGNMTFRGWNKLNESQAALAAWRSRMEQLKL